MDNNEIRGGKENILPDAANLFYALRSLGYKNTAAVADLVDNSIDAGASNIWVTIESDLSKIFIADNGCGMSESVLRNAIRLGGKKMHDGNKDLGKYGLGLITASISMGRVVRIITKYNGEYNTAILDYDKIRETSLFIADFNKSTDAERMSFDYRTKNAESGTVLIIDNCDKLQYTKVKDLIDDLNDALGQTFRVYISEGNEISINGSEVRSYDPLLLAVKGVKRLVDQDITIESKSGASGKMHVLAVQIPDQGPKKNKSLHLNIKGQGFYVLRNNREIASGLEFPQIFTKHNDYNLLRIEISFSQELDDLMGINLKKHDVTPSMEVVDALNSALFASIKGVREEMKIKQKTKRAENPFIVAPDNGGVDKPGEGMPEPTGLSGTEEVVPPSTFDEEDLDFQVVSYAGKDDGPIFNVSLSKNVVTIRYNIKSEYYSANILHADNMGVERKAMLDSFITASLRAYVHTTGSVASLPPFADELAKRIESEE